MLVNQELQKEVQRTLHPFRESTGRRRHTAYKIVPADTCRKDLDKVLSGESDIPRRVIRAIAKVAGKPVSTYLK